MFKDSPRLREYMTGYADDLGAIKLTLQHMIIYMAWANSPSRLSNRPAMYAYADEEDKFPVTGRQKGDRTVDLLNHHLGWSDWNGFRYLGRSKRIRDLLRCA